MKKSKASKRKTVADLLPTIVHASVTNCMLLVNDTNIFEPYNNTEFAESLRSTNGLLFKDFFAPEYVSLPPPLMESDGDELIWFDLTRSRDVRIAFTTSDFHIQEKLLKLVKCSFQHKLNAKERLLMLAALRVERDFIKRYELIPDEFPNLVENNPTISLQLLFKLMESPEYDVMEYLYVLVNMPVTLHSMGVVNQLITAFKLPIEFIHLYASNCIAACEMLTDKDLQIRLVRVVCVFLQSLIRNNAIDIGEMHLEILAFCTEYHEIKEAIALYRLARHLQNVEERSSGPPNCTDLSSFEPSASESGDSPNNSNNEEASNSSMSME